MIAPLNDRIVVQRVTPAVPLVGVIIPETAQPQNQHGVVVAVGPGRRDKRGYLKPLAVREGDKIVFQRFAGDGEHDDLVLMREEDILAIVDGE